MGHGKADRYSSDNAYREEDLGELALCTVSIARVKSVQARREIIESAPVRGNSFRVQILCVRGGVKEVYWQLE